MSVLRFLLCLGLIGVFACGDDGSDSNPDAGGSDAAMDGPAMDGPAMDGSPDAAEAGGGDAEADAGDDAATPGLPDTWDQEVRAPVAEDVNDDPNVVEVNIEARTAQVEYAEGVTTDVWTFNGSIPAPTIEAKVGDTVIVHLTNNLPEETTIHWHGLEVPALMDGSHISQVPVEPGGTFTYEFEVLTAALYWYHPHFRSNEQVEKGMYGMLVVRDEQEDASFGIPENELLLALDDVLLDETGQVAEPFPADPLERAAVQLNGREGNTFLVNGKVEPTVQVVAGVPIRLRMVNAANVRFYRVSIADHDFYRIGTDGGLVAEPTTHQPIDQIPHPMDAERTISNPDAARGILLTPGERADVVFTPGGEPGDVLLLEWHDFPRGLHRVFRNADDTIGMEHDHADGKRPPVSVLRFEIVEGGGGQPVPWRPPETLREIEQIPASEATGEPLGITFGHGMPDADGNVTFFAQMIDGMPRPFSVLTTDEALQATVGETRIWEITNMTGGDHNFHPHGFFFQPLEVEFVDMDEPGNNRTVPFDQLENRDTIRVPARPGAPGRSRTILRLVTRFDDTGREGMVEAFGKEPSEGQSGGWLAHCHILEHAGRGMMTWINLREP